jgi:predicted DNA-binding transcriptional regulator AlpA
MFSAKTTTKEAFNVAEFCDAHGISRSLFYDLMKRGKGPRIIKAGVRTLITRDASAEWRRRMEMLSNRDAT